MRVACLITLLALAGCASTPPEEPPRPFRFAVLPAPALGEPGSVDRLYEALDRLSREAALDVCLVPGPLLAAGPEGDDPILRDELAGALGSLPAPVVVALAGSDAPREAELLDALERAFQGQPTGAKGHTKRGWQVVPVRPDGSAAPPPGGEAPPRRLLVIGRGVEPAGGAAGAVRVEVGEALALEEAAGAARLVLPPLAVDPGLLAVGVHEGGQLSLVLLPLSGDAPPAPPAVKTP